MHSWILACALVLAAGGGWAEDGSTVRAADVSAAAESTPAAAADDPVAIPAPDTVPPIPAPWEPMEAETPLDAPWPAAASDAPRMDAPGQPAVPPVPGPEIASLAEASGAAAEATPSKPRPPFDPAGTIHVVEKGDTLWDISDLYLGTPWIWPSVWKDNDDIENPHLILPGDKIWVSASEMRKVSDAEAAALLAARGEGDVETDPVPAAMAEDAPAVPTPVARERFRYAELGTVGLVREKELKGYAQIVGTAEEQVFTAQGDAVFVDLGRGDVQVGDQFTAFRTSQKVYDPATRRPLGYHTEIVGWLEIVEVYDESSRAKVRMSYAEFMPGVHLKPRETIDPQIVIQESPPGVEGQLADLLLRPKYNAGGDIVVLNRGSEDGLEVGSPLEVYRPASSQWKEEWYGRQPDITIPHEVVAQMIVVTVQPQSAMAYVRRANTELQYGDRFRTVDGPSVEWPEDGLFILPRIKGLLARVPRPDLDVPDAMADWNVPRLPLPGLDGYDAR